MAKQSSELEEHSVITVNGNQAIIMVKRTKTKYSSQSMLLDSDHSQGNQAVITVNETIQSLQSRLLSNGHSKGNQAVITAKGTKQPAQLRVPNSHHSEGGQKSLQTMGLCSHHSQG